MNLKVREQIKSLLAEKGMTMKTLAELLSAKTNKKYSLANLSAKLQRGSLTYNEVVVIANILEYDIKFISFSD